MSLRFIVSLIALALAVILKFGFEHVKSRRDLPQGPKGYLFFGHLRVIPKAFQWKTFAEWAKKYGDIVYVHIFGRPIIILNSFEHAQELMEKRGAIYSDRPPMVLINDMMKVRSVTFMRYGDLWRKHRRVIQQYFNSRTVSIFRPQQIFETHCLLSDILRDPEKLPRHVKRYTASTILSIAYGHHATSIDDPLIGLSEKAGGLLFRPGPPGSTIVDFFPILKHVPSWLPGWQYKSDSMVARNAIREMMDVPFDLVMGRRKESEMGSGSITSYFMDNYVKSQQIDADDITTIKEVGASLYRAGTETTATVIHVFMFYMVLNRGILKKAQAEIDAVVGDDRLPELEDRVNLPYIDCIMKECLRRHPPFPIGIAHRVIRDDALEGKLIPEGSMIIPNVWSMMHDERNYSDPFSFNPDRFSNSPHGKTQLPLDPTSAVFGFGRRICPGRHLAEISVWLAMSHILSVFDILPASDEDGHEITPEIQFSSGILSRLKYNCRIVPRSEKAALLVKRYAPASL